MSWVRIDENYMILAEGIMGIKQLDDGVGIKYVNGQYRVLKGVSAQTVLNKVTLMKVTQSPQAPDEH